MSCAESPPGVDCGQVLDNVYEYLHGELDPSRLEVIRRHLEQCPECLREYGLEQVVRELLHRSCHRSAPPSLRAAVLTRIDTLRSQSL